MKEIALHDELRLAQNLILTGFGELQELKIDNEEHFISHQLLSSGFERAMKCYLVLDYKSEFKEFPTSKYLKECGHDLIDLKNKVFEKIASIKDYGLVCNDYLFAEKDSDLNEALEILTDFGKQARYHNLNVVTGQEKPISPNEKWEELQKKVLPITFKDEASWLKEVETFYLKANVKIIKKFERFCRFLSRLFVVDKNDFSFKPFSVSFNICRGTMDDDFGCVDYRKSSKILKKEQHLWKKRSKTEVLSSKWPTKVVSKSELKGNWPFAKPINEVIVEKCDGIFYVINVEGYDFALNGCARSKFNLPDVHEAGISEVGKSVGELITIAENLKKTNECLEH